MSFQVVVVGLPNSGRTSLMKYLKYSRVSEDDQIEEPVTIQVKGANWVFSESWEQQIETANCVIFCIDGTNLDELTQVKELYNEMVSRIPSTLRQVVIVQTKADQQAIDPGELQQFLQVQDLQKEIMMAAISTIRGEGVSEMVEWIQEQITKNVRKVSFEFEAEPRVVKSRGKYKINEQQMQSKSQQTFNVLMKDKRIKLLEPVQQEQEYIRLEKERIKVDNMRRQMDKFKLNKKKMTPYDIKPLDGKKQNDKNNQQEDEKDGEKASIEVNLEFFLTDFKDTIEKTTSTVDTQTDQFNEPPPSPPSIPKKTGIDHATQVEDYELFDFDREVTPILDVICTKTLEEASLEIEQEEELLAMKRFKEAYFRKRAGDKDKQHNVVVMEKNEIERKDNLLKKYLEREERKVQLLRKAQGYQIAGHYLAKLQHNVVLSVHNNGFFPNDFQNTLRTNFVDWLVQSTLKEATRLIKVKQNLNGAFDPDNLPPVKIARLAPDAIVKKKQLLAERRRINLQSILRVVRMVYYDEAPQPSTIAQKLPKMLDGTLDEYEKQMELRLQEIEQKLELDQMNEEEFLTIKKTEFPELPIQYLGVSVSKIKRLAFSMAHNQFYVANQEEKKLEPFVLVIEKSGKWNLIDQSNLRDGKIIKYKTNFRLANQKVADDVGIMVRLDQLDNEVIGMIYGLRLKNLQVNTQSQVIQDFLQYARFGVYDGEFMIPFDQTNVIQAFKLEELVKQQDNPDLQDAPQTGVLICYSLVKRFKQYGRWFLEGIKQPQKGLVEEEVGKFYQRLSSFVVEQYEFNLVKDKDYIERLLEKENEGNPVSAEERVNVGYRRKVKLANQGRTNESKDQSVIEQAMKSVDEPQEVPKSLHCSRVMQSLKLEIGEEFGDLEAKIIKHLQDTEQVLVDSCLHGFELHSFNKPFVRSRQLIRVKNIGNLTLVRKPEPPPQKVEEQPQDNLDNAENNSKAGDD